MTTTMAGCNSSSKGAPATGAPKVQRGGSITVIGVGEPDGFNLKIPARQNGVTLEVMAGVWPGVWRVTPDFQFLLNTDLMVSAEMTATDPQTVVYKIRPDAVWSDGAPVDAEDFIYNWQATRPGATDIDGSPLQGNPPPGGGDPVASVTGSDGGKTVTMVYKDHFVQWQNAFFNFLVPAHVARGVGWNTGFDRFDPNVVVSCGPFRIASYNPGKDLTLVRNERYWGAAASLDSIVFRFTTAEAAITAYKNGEADLNQFVGGGQDVLTQLRQLPGVTTQVAPGPSQEYLGFNQRNEFLALPEVRRAFALALDRRAIVERSQGRGSGVAIVDSFLFANNQPEYRDTSGGRYDRPDGAGAKRLLEGIGFALGPDGVYARDGKRLSLRIRTLTDTPENTIEEELVQAQAKQAGIELRVDNAPFKVIVPQLAKGDFDVEIFNYGKSQFGSSNQFRPGNRWAYANPTPNQLIQQTSNELDHAKRLALLERADQTLWDDLPVVPLYQAPSILAVRNSFANVAPNTASPSGAFWDVERWAKRAPG